MLLHSVVANISSKSRERVGNYDKNAIIGQRAFKTPATFDWCTRPDQVPVPMHPLEMSAETSPCSLVNRKAKPFFHHHFKAHFVRQKIQNLFIISKSQVCKLLKWQVNILI